MTRTEFEKYLGQKVELSIFDGTVIRGTLHKTGEEMFKNDADLYIPKNWYFCTDSNGECVSCLFRVSHVKKVVITYPIKTLASLEKLTIAREDRNLRKGD